MIAYEERILCVQKEKAILAQKLDDATQKGRQEGRQEGILIGKERGIKIGEEKGKKQTKIAVAKNSLKAGFHMNVIVEITGLSVDEIKQLNLQELFLFWYLRAL